MQSMIFFSLRQKDRESVCSVFAVCELSATGQQSQCGRNDDGRGERAEKHQNDFVFLPVRLHIHS